MNSNSFLIIFCCIFSTLFCRSQTTAFSDNFSDGDLSSDPKWLGELSKFEILNGELHLNDTAQLSPAYISTASEVAHKAVWKLKVRLGFAPSTSNYAQIYLCSDRADLSNANNAYFIQLGGQSGTDDNLRLYKKTIEGEELLIKGTLGRFGIYPSAAITVERDSSGMWKLYSDTSILGNKKHLEGSFQDTSYISCSYFGIRCIYTSSRADLFYFDDIMISGEKIQDTSAPQLQKLEVLNDSSLLLNFSERIDSVSAVDKSNYIVSAAVGNPVSIEYYQASHEIVLKFKTQFKQGTLYTIQIQNLKDLSENQIVSLEKDFIYFIPEKIEAGDIVINEILFNPRSGGADFLELYNRSDKILSLESCFLANLEDGFISNQKEITMENTILFPNSYLAFTENKENILWEYPYSIEKKLVQIDNMPPYNNDKGSAYLLDSMGNTIDFIHYTEDMHFALLKDLEGVSLERINPHLPGTYSNNFHSASEDAGFATPAYQNSQYFIGRKKEGKISIEPRIFSPDNDGYHDNLYIHYSFNAPGFVGSISIFDSAGRLIVQLVNNELLGKEGTFIWDGISDKGEKAGVGIYIIYISAFNLAGEIREFKKTCVLGAYLD